MATPIRVLSSWVGPRPPVVNTRLQPSDVIRLSALEMAWISSLTVIFSLTRKFRALSWLMIHWLLVSRTMPSKISLPMTRIPIWVVKEFSYMEPSYYA